MHVNVAMASPRLVSQFSDDELKTLVKNHMATSPLASLTFYRTATLDDVCQAQEGFFVALAQSKSRLNKGQLAKVMQNFFKGDKREFEEVCAKMSAAYSQCLTKRHNVKNGAKLGHPCRNILSAYLGKELENVSEASANKGGDAEQTHSAPDELLAAARARFREESPPPQKNIHGHHRGQPYHCPRVANAG